jgi:putative salt-induced outer membrane protein YdiY
VRTETGGTFAAERTSVATLRSSEEQREVERLEAPNWLQLWEGTADFGLALASGNADTTTVTSGVALVRATPRDKMTVTFAQLFTRDNEREEDATLANLVRGGVRYDYNFDKRLFGYGTTEVETNALQNLDLRLVLGGGLGYRAVRNERTQLDLFGGAVWNHEWFADELERDSGEAQVGQSFGYRFNDRVAFKQQFVLYPNMTQMGELRHNFDASLSTAINHRLSWQVAVSNRYISNPPVGRDGNDLFVTTGLKFKIGRIK